MWGQNYPRISPVSPTAALDCLTHPTNSPTHATRHPDTPSNRSLPLLPFAHKLTERVTNGVPFIAPSTMAEKKDPSVDIVEQDPGVDVIAPTFSKTGCALVHDSASHGWDDCWLEVTDGAISCYDAQGGKLIRRVAISDEVSDPREETLSAHVYSHLPSTQTLLSNLPCAPNWLLKASPRNGSRTPFLCPFCALFARWSSTSSGCCQTTPGGPGIPANSHSISCTRRSRMRFRTAA